MYLYLLYNIYCITLAVSEIHAETPIKLKVIKFAHTVQATNQCHESGRCYCRLLVLGLFKTSQADKQMRKAIPRLKERPGHQQMDTNQTSLKG